MLPPTLKDSRVRVLPQFDVLFLLLFVKWKLEDPACPAAAPDANDEFTRGALGESAAHVSVCAESGQMLRSASSSSVNGNVSRSAGDAASNRCLGVASSEQTDSLANAAPYQEPQRRGSEIISSDESV